MGSALPLLIANIVCSFLPCQVHNRPPYIRYSNTFTEGRGPDWGGKNTQNDKSLVHTKAGSILGKTLKISETKEIVSFTGVPFGESTAGNRRFRDPVAKKPWKGIWKAISPSPTCIQPDPAEARLMGTEDCLYLDLYAPQVSNGSKFPVVFWIPGGANVFGRSSFLGPNYFLKEDIVLVIPNFRLGPFGFLSTGDKECSGNWALKDISLALKWTYDNVEAFGGDPNRITVGGLSSGGNAAHLMLFTNHEVKKYVKGIITLSGSVMANNGLDSTGRVQLASDVIARNAGCPTAAQGKTFEMMECLRKVDATVLTFVYFINLNILPKMSFALSATIEPPDVPGAFITELPETLYEKGRVPKIPLIATRTKDETSVMITRNRFPALLLTSMFWDNLMPRFLKLGIRCCKLEMANSKEETMRSLKKITKFYFNTTAPPVISKQKDFLAMVKLSDDVIINAGVWKAIEYHHRVAPTYSYLMSHNTFTHVNPLIKLAAKILLRDFSSSHATEFVLLFNNNKIPALKSGSDFETVSRNLINFIANFAAFGEPLYRTPKGELLPLWRPIRDMSEPWVLDVGLVHNISMIKDPLAGTMRLKIWDTVKF